jgi:pyruvate/2-oxoglutarate dehydrogenase complex dihydrolipoamide dehydrogenase (E3) component
MSTVLAEKVPTNSIAHSTGLLRKRGKFDLLVVGGELALALADEAVRLGAHVALAYEPGQHRSDHGTAVRRGMIQAGRMGCQSARDVFLRWSTQERIQQVIDYLPTKLQSLRERATVIEGHAVFTGRDSCAIHGREIRFAKAILAPAHVSQLPAIPGLSTTTYFTSQDWHLLPEIPHRIAVLGSGPVACEFAQAFVRTGVEVHLITTGTTLLAGFAREAVGLLEQTLLREGVRLHQQSTCLGIETIGRMKALALSGQEGRRKVFVDELIVADERAPAIDRMALPAARIAVRDGRIRTKSQLRTSNPRVFAVNDECSHAGQIAQVAATCVRNVLLSGRLRIEQNWSARTVMTLPQIVSIGPPNLCLGQTGRDVEIFCATQNDILPETFAGEQFMAIVAANATNGRIAGATLIGEGAGGLMMALQIAVQRKLSLPTLAALAVPDCLGIRVLQHVGRQFMERCPASHRGRRLWSRNAA